MATQNNTTCAICGKAYRVCVSCKSHSLTPWKIHTDTAEHYQVFQILRGVTLGIYTKSEAKEKLEYLDLKDVDTYLLSIQNRIQKIIGHVDVEPVVDTGESDKEDASNDETVSEPIVEKKTVTVKGKKTSRKGRN